MNPPTKPTRVLMTADAMGGVWSYALQLALSLGPFGFEFTIACMGREPSPTQQEEAAAIPSVRLEVSAAKLEWMDDPWRDVDSAGRWLLELARRDGPNLVHLNGYAHADLPFGAPVLVAAHSCVLSWWRAVRREPAPDSWAAYKARVTGGLAAADAVVAPTRWMLEQIERTYCPVKLARVIPNAVDPARFRPGKKDRMAMAAGRFWDEAKNLAVLREVAPRLTCELRVAGDASRSGDQALPPVEKGTSPTLLGRLDGLSLAREYARASVFVHPARYEPFGLAPVEAALAGCALVLADIPSLREVWADAAVFVDPDDPAAIAGAIESLMADPAALHARAQRARRRALAYSPDRSAANYRFLYADLIDVPAFRAAVAKEPVAVAP